MNKIIREDLSTISNKKLEWSELSNKNILVTGTNGILPSFGIETILFLINIERIKNTKVFALARNKEKVINRFSYHLNNDSLKFIIQDVNDAIHIKESINIIIHAASQASSKYYVVDPVGTLKPNILGTINLLNLAREKQVKNFIFFSSAEIYGDVLSQQRIKESDLGQLDPMNIRSCYAESKRMGETICMSYHSQFHIPVKIIRPFHTYGSGMNLKDGRIFADFVSNIIKNKNLVINSDGCARRAFFYIQDAVLAYFYIIFKGKTGEAYNVGNPS